MARPGIAHVFCFENRGEEIGVTLTHPHGQIYGYPYLAPRARADAARGARPCRPHRRQPVHRHPRASEVADGNRIIAQSRAVHRVRAVRRTLAGRGAHLSEPVRAQPR